MAYFICIETATQLCSVALSENDRVIDLRETSRKNSHAEVLSLFVDDVLKKNALQLSDLDAVAVSKGPGSYTGLRIGVSTAKGLCYAGDKPLIAIHTLSSMAAGMIARQKLPSDRYLFCPMIDARRMEVYAAFYDGKLNELRKTQADIVDVQSYADFLTTHTVLFFGDGASKCKAVIKNKHAEFIDHFSPSAAYMAPLVFQAYRNQQFEDVAYFEPYYLKDFVAGIPRVKGLR